MHKYDAQTPTGWPSSSQQSKTYVYKQRSITNKHPSFSLFPAQSKLPMSPTKPPQLSQVDRWRLGSKNSVKSRARPRTICFSAAPKQLLQTPLGGQRLQRSFGPWHEHRGLWKATHETPTRHGARGRACPAPHVLRSATEGPAALRAPGAPRGPPGRKPQGGWYLGGPDLADAGFLGQAADAADEAERVAELLPAGLEHGTLGRRHELGRVARPAAPRHGPRGRGAPPPGAQGGEGRPGRSGARPGAEAHPPAALPGGVTGPATERRCRCPGRGRSPRPSPAPRVPARRK